MKKIFFFQLTILFFSGNMFAIKPDHPERRSSYLNQKIQSSPSPPHVPNVTEGLRGAGLCFTPNKGQLINNKGEECPDILYKGRGAGADIYLRKTGISYVHSNIGEVIHKMEEEVEDMEKTMQADKAKEKKLKDELMQRAIVNGHRLDMEFINADRNAITTTEDEVEGCQNFYYAHCPQGITNVKQYNQIIRHNIYKNIDVKYYGDKSQGLKYDIIVNPHADPGQIKLQWKGAEELKVVDGKLIIKTSINEFTESIPKVYQVINGKVIDVKAGYKLDMRPAGRQAECEMLDMRNKSNSHIYEVTFQLGTWNPELPLIIDPWVSYYGGSTSDFSVSVTTDPSGNVAFCGGTQSINFPTLGAFQSNLSGIQNAYIAKMNSNGNLLWATYFGGTNVETANGISSDISGNILVSGETRSTDFPVGFSGANVVHQNISGGAGYDAFLFKFDSNGLRMWATYYGGTDTDYSSDVTTFGNIVYLYGFTKSLNAISTPGIFQTTLSGSTDVFVVKFSSNGSRVWGTYVGGSNFEHSGGIACDPSSGNISAVGTTQSADFPVSGAFQPVYGGSTDAFLFNMSPAGGMLWSTFYGGPASDMYYQTVIAIDGQSNIIMGGSTNSTSAIASAGSYQVGSGGNGDGYLAKFNSNGIRQWGTYIGGNNGEIICGISTDSNNNIYICGEFEDTDAGNYPINPCAYQPNFGGGPSGTMKWPEDQFIAKFDANGIQRCITYMGGTQEDDLDGFVGAGAGNITVYGSVLYITGATQGGYPVTPGAFQTIYSGGTAYSAGEVFIDQLCINICEAKVSGLNFTASQNNLCANQVVTFTPSTIKNTCDTSSYTFEWIFPGGVPASSTAKNPVVFYPTPGIYPVKLYLNTSCRKDSIIKNSIITINNCSCTLSATTSITSNVNCYNKNNGSAKVTISNAGSGPYTYSWSNGSSGTTSGTTISITGLSANTYTVTITEGSCKSTSIVTISQPPQINAGFISKWECKTNNATATVFPANGSAPFSYIWNNGQTTATATGLTISTYSVTVTDVNGCTAIGSVPINSNPPINLTTSSVNNYCSISNGSVSVAVTTNSGVAPYTYLWSNGQTGLTSSGLVNGTYSITVTDSKSCTAIGTASVTGNPNTAVATFTQSPAGNVCINTLVNFTGTGTSGTYVWQIAPTSPLVTGATANFSYTFLTVGTYTVYHTVTTNGCTSRVNSTVNVINCNNPTVTATGSSICSGTCATVTSSGVGGVVPYTYSWSDGSVTQNINPCPTLTTTYTVTIKDTGGNSSTSTAVITVNPAVSVTTIATNITCNGSTNGSASASGGNGTSPYAYNWSNGQTTQISTSLVAGNYTVTVTDAKGCTSSSTATVISPPPLTGQFAKGTANCAACGCKKWIMVNGIGGTNPYSYSWPDGYVNRYKNQLCPGAYNVNIKDKNGCSVNVNLIAP